jgi:hypothetical protein
MLPLTRDIVITMNLINSRVDTLPHRVLMIGIQGLMHLTMLDLFDLRIMLDRKVLEVIPDQVYLISPQTQRWFIIIITIIIIIHQKDPRGYMVIRPLLLPLLLEIET